MNSNVRFEPEADAEYRAAGRWYEEHKLSGCESWSAGPAVRRAPVKRFPYHVIYLELNAEIRVLAVAHDRRKPGHWRDRI